MSRKPLTSPFESFIEAQIRQAQDLNQRIARLNSRVADGPPTSLAPVDVEAVIRRWRER